MNKLYVSYIPKVQGDKADFNLIHALTKCMRYYRGNNHIISSPGYMSSIATTKNFVNEFVKMVPASDPIYIGYLKGLTGKMNVSGSTDKIDEHYKEFLSTGKFNKLSIEIANKTDHRKMMFFYGIQENLSFDFTADILNNATLDRFLNSITVNAVLIGSSNQSYNTYFGGTTKIADKGEADIIMFVLDETISAVETMNVEHTIIFEAISGVTSEPHDDLKQMLKDFLTHALL